MAAPNEMTTLNITGRFIFNKALSDDLDPVLARQGVGWFTRSAIAFATLTLDIKHYKATEDDDRSKKDVERIDINQTITGGIKGTTELRSLDWVERSHYDHIFKNVMGKSRRVKLAEIEDEYLKTGWPEELVEEGLIESFVMSEENAWAATQIWGFEYIEVGGEKQKRYVRHLKFEKEAERLNKMMIYDYIGPTPAVE